MPIIINSTATARREIERPKIVHYCRCKDEYCEYAEVVDNFLFCNHMAGPSGQLIQLTNKNATANLNMGTACPIQKNLVADYYRHLNDHPEEAAPTDEGIDF